MLEENASAVWGRFSHVAIESSGLGKGWLRLQPSGLKLSGGGQLSTEDSL